MAFTDRKLASAPKLHAKPVIEERETAPSLSGIPRVLCRKLYKVV
jgi:hypothetical protein